MNNGYESTLVWLTMNHDAVLQALKKLNSTHGRGDISNYDPARQKITCKLQYGMAHAHFKVWHLRNGAHSIELYGHRARV